MGVSRIKYYKNISTPRHPTWFSYYKNITFPTQIFRVLLVHTFRTLFRTSEAILEEPPVEGGSGSLYRRFHAP